MATVAYVSTRPARTLTGFDQVCPPLSEWLRTMLNTTLRAIRVHARYTRPRCGLAGELSTAMAGLSSSLAVPSAATRIGFDHAASGPARTTT